MGFLEVLNLFFLGYTAILEHPLISWTTKVARLISIDPTAHLTWALQAAAFVLRDKKIICVFPEGRRSVDEHMGEFKKGIGILVKELDIPVVPIYIKGSHYSWPRTSRLPRLFYPLRIIFGKPLAKKELLKKTEAEAVQDDYEVIARNLREEIKKLAC
jgi:long-chain acyl-CoA synthetase